MKTHTRLRLALASLTLALSILAAWNNVAASATLTQLPTQQEEENKYTAYGWVGQAQIVHAKTGEKTLVRDHGTVCAKSRPEARRLAKEKLSIKASAIGTVVSLTVELTGGE